MPISFEAAHRLVSIHNANALKVLNDSHRLHICWPYLFSDIKINDYVCIKVKILIWYNPILYLFSIWWCFTTWPPTGNWSNLGVGHHPQVIQISMQLTSQAGLAQVLSYPMSLLVLILPIHRGMEGWVNPWPGWVGIEPGTCCMTVCCSTNSAIPAVICIHITNIHVHILHIHTHPKMYMCVCL